MAQLTCKNLCLGYEGRTVSENINFSIDAGNYLCIIGENGSGKSTLVKTLVGLTLPLSGEIIFDDGLTRKDMGYLPQQTPVQRDFPASVDEIVLSGCLADLNGKPFYTKEHRRKAFENMEKLNISDLSGKCYANLSGGQQQRVLLARALCATHKMLLLDEPVSGLDPQSTAEMYSIVKKINEEDKITIIMISHDTEAAFKYASHILHLGRGLQYFGANKHTPLNRRHLK